MTTEPVDFRRKQLEFTRYIRDPEANPIPPDVKPERMAMYRELIFNNIDGFLANNFPVIRKILDGSQWFELIQDFFSSHRCKTPYFSEIAEEFLNYLENERSAPDDYPFLLELAHYEWVEMALSIAKDSPRAPTNPTSENLSSQEIELSPLAWPLAYQFPVQAISPDFLPTAPSEQPTCLIVYRNLDDDVKFLEINPITYRMLEIIQENGRVNVLTCLEQIAKESQHPHPQAIIDGGLQILQELVEKSIIHSSGN